MSVHLISFIHLLYLQLNILGVVRAFPIVLILFIILFG